MFPLCKNSVLWPKLRERCSDCLLLCWKKWESQVLWNGMVLFPLAVDTDRVVASFPLQEQSLVAASFLLFLGLFISKFKERTWKC